jgi:uroporphyrinogen-III synthase
MVSIADTGATVLVTRSEPGASELADALQAAGYSARRCPLLEIRPLDPAASSEVVAELDRFDIAICVSSHAARFALDRIDAQWTQRPELKWVAVGAATARTLAERGVKALRPATESSEGILALAPLSRIVGLRVLICAGRDGRPLLVEELSRRGARVTTLALYERVAVPVERAAAELGDRSATGAVIVSSADGARAFAPAWRAVRGDERVVVIAPSARVAAELSGLGFTRVTVASGAGAQATIEALRKIDEESR